MNKASKFTSFLLILCVLNYIIIVIIDKSINSVGKLKLNTQQSRVSPRPHEDRRLGRSTKITDSDGKIIEINFQDLATLEHLGRGQYGSVTKVKHRPTQMVLAAKVSLVLIYFIFSKFYF